MGSRGSVYVYVRTDVHMEQQQQQQQQKQQESNNNNDVSYGVGDYAFGNGNYNDNNKEEEEVQQQQKQQQYQWKEHTILESPKGDGGKGDYFGVSVAISPSGQTIAVGAEGDVTIHGVNAGSVHVFVMIRQQGSNSNKNNLNNRINNNNILFWEDAIIVPEKGRASDEFGHSVSVPNDRYVVVGAHRAGSKSSGTVQVYRKKGDSNIKQHQQQQEQQEHVITKLSSIYELEIELIPPSVTNNNDIQPYDFGGSLSSIISTPSYDGSQRFVVVIGAPGLSFSSSGGSSGNGSSNSDGYGSVYVYARYGVLNHDNDNDYNSNNNDDDTLSSRWRFETKLIPNENSGNDNNDHFGKSVAISWAGTTNNNNKPVPAVETIVIGAHMNGGSVHIVEACRQRSQLLIASSSSPPQIPSFSPSNKSEVVDNMGLLNKDNIDYWSSDSSKDGLYNNNNDNNNSGNQILNDSISGEETDYIRPGTDNNNYDNNNNDNDYSNETKNDGEDGDYFDNFYLSTWIIIPIAITSVIVTACARYAYLRRKLKIVNNNNNNNINNDTTMELQQDEEMVRLTTDTNNNNNEERHQKKSFGIHKQYSSSSSSFSQKSIEENEQQQQQPIRVNERFTRNNYD